MWIKPVTEETISEASRAIAEREGVRIGSVKSGTLLQNAVVFDCVEMNGWRMDAELQRLVGKRLGDILEYTISRENNSQKCLKYFTGCLMDQGIDPETYQWTEEEQLIVDYAKAICRDFHNIPQDVKDRLLAAYTEEQIAVITGMAVVITADNMFESIMEIPA